MSQADLGLESGSGCSEGQQLTFTRLPYSFLCVPVSGGGLSVNPSRNAI